MCYKYFDYAFYNNFYVFSNLLYNSGSNYILLGKLDMKKVSFFSWDLLNVVSVGILNNNLILLQFFVLIMNLNQVKLIINKIFKLLLLY